MAQFGGYLGPGILSRGSGDIGQRAGQQVDLRFFVDVTGIYDSSLQPFSLNSQGGLLRVNGLYGEQVDVGGYGVHTWRQAQLGLDYYGNFYHYDNDSFYDGSNQALSLGYTYQKSRRLSFDFRVLAGTTKLGYGAPGFYGASSSAIPTNTGGYPNRVNRIPAPAVAADPARALQNIVIAAAVLRSLSGVSFMSRLYSPGALIHCAAEKHR